MAAEKEPSYELWSRLAFVLCLGVAALYVYLGLRPGGRGPILAYTLGPLVLGLASALMLSFGLFWSVLRRPVLQRKRIHALVLLAASLWLCSFPFAYPSSHENHPSTVPFRLPFAGEWIVRWGGDAREQNRLVLDPARRFGLVFERDPASPEEPVLAPAPGRVARIGSGEGEGSAAALLVLEVAADEFLVIEGILAGSTLVLAGDDVEAGAPLGRPAGPELTLHLQDSPDPGNGEGIPLTFRAYLADERPVERGLPVRGEKVRPVDGPPR